MSAAIMLNYTGRHGAIRRQNRTLFGVMPEIVIQFIANTYGDGGYTVHRCGDVWWFNSHLLHVEITCRDDYTANACAWTPEGDLIMNREIYIQPVQEGKL